MVQTIIKNHRQSPRKVRLVADLVRGKKVNHALTVLDFLSKKASEPIKGAIESAVANARHNFNMDPERLYVKDIRVDEGTVLKRYSPKARGSASIIKKRTSHIFVALDTKGNETLLAGNTKSGDAVHSEKKEGETGSLE